MKTLNLNWGGGYTKSEVNTLLNDYIPKVGGGGVTGNFRLTQSVNNNEIAIDGGTGWNEGSSLVVRGKTHNYHGRATINCNDGTNSTRLDLYPDGTWTWNGQPVQYVSDQRLKQQIAEIDNNLLDAWEDVDLVQFKYNDAVNEKGNVARLHTGYVVQQIDDACKSHNIDISEYGLYCHEEYPQETEEVEVKQDDGTIKKETKVIREASEHYSLRYTETLVVECAYLRREINRLKEQMKK